MKKINLLAGLIGNALEWYDFLLYAYFATILAPLFFPAENYFFSLLLTFSVFSIGFLARPLGAMFIGRMGDLYGRKRALLFSISVMSICTFAIGLLPTYQMIGIFAPICLTIIRCLQGFAVAGEIGTSAAFVIEHASAKNRGLFGSLVLSTAYLGIFLGVVMVTLTTYFIPADLLKNWGWRIPFLLALPWGILGLILRLRAIESLEVRDERKTPIKTVFSDYSRFIMLAVGLVAINATGDYFFIGYFTTFLAAPGSILTLKDAMLINMISLFLFLFFVPLFGAWSDRVGRKKIFLLGLLGLILLSLPIFYLLAQKTFFSALAAEIIFAFFLAAIDGVIMTLLAESFPAAIRNTGVTVTYNISLTIFGGTAPFIALSIVHLTNLSYAPAIYGIFIGLLALSCLAFFRETFDSHLSVT